MTKKKKTVKLSKDKQIKQLSALVKKLKTENENLNRYVINWRDLYYKEKQTKDKSKVDLTQIADLLNSYKTDDSCSCCGRSSCCC